MSAFADPTEDTGVADYSGPISPNGLGECARCHAGLCLRGNEVGCSTCGLPVPNHPITVADRAARAALRPARDIYPAPAEHAGTWGDRVLSLEKRLAAAETEISMLKQGARKR